MTATTRPWTAIAEAVDAARRGDPRGLTHTAFVDLLWGRLAGTGVSWLGIYLADPRPGNGAGPARQLLLGARRDKPACSPIGLHGVCGQSFLQDRGIVVRDVLDLGEAYVACDPRDRSEAVVPLRSEDGVWGVLDLDSHQVGSFSDADLEGLRRCVAAADLQPDRG
ncbi:MAG: GAF domain-containing protein [Phycisphaerales bacterium]